MVMELYGAKDYFDCTKALFATDGLLMADAVEVAKKLNIEILIIDGSVPMPTKKTLEGDLSSSSQDIENSSCDKLRCSDSCP